MAADSLTLTQKRVAAGVLVGIVVLFAIYLLAALGSGDTAPEGTKVANVEIGGMTEEEAAAAVTARLATRATRPVKLIAGDVTVKVSPADAGLALDAQASVAPAYGRTWNPVALLTGASAGRLPLVASVDEEALNAEVTQLADVVAEAPVEPRVVVTRNAAKIKDGTPGRALDVAATSELLQDAFLKVRKPQTAPVVEVPPTITPEARQEALQLARAAVAASVTVQADSATVTLTGADIGAALSFTQEGGSLVPKLNGAKLHRALRTQLASIETPGRDATFKIRRNVPRVVSSKVGRGVEDDELAAKVAGVLGNDAGDRSVTVSVGVREPKLTTADAVSLGIREKISSFTQSYPYAAYRSQNIGQAAKRINGTLLMPGDTFSLNDTILERTVANGYTTGYVVGVGGVFQEDLGGGVSTSATALWTAAFFAGMERVQTVAHSIWISRYEAGLEATVAWGIFDLKFRNDTPNAVFIQAKTTPTSITVTFWGTPEYDKIEAEPGPRTNVVKFSKIYNDSPECSPQGGIDGFTIVVDRVFYKNGEEVRREPITTRYKPAPQVICDEKPKKKKPKKDADQATGDQEFEEGADPSPSASSSEDPEPEASATPSKKPGKKPSKEASQSPTDPDVFSN